MYLLVQIILLNTLGNDSRYIQTSDCFCCTRPIIGLYHWPVVVNIWVGAVSEIDVIIYCSKFWGVLGGLYRPHSIYKTKDAELLTPKSCHLLISLYFYRQILRKMDRKILNFVKSLVTILSPPLRDSTTNLIQDSIGQMR